MDFGMLDEVVMNGMCMKSVAFCLLHSLFLN
jgi:hypothetical protein